MKQYISIEQLKELNKDELVKLNSFTFNTYLQRIAHPEWHTHTEQDWIEAVCRINIGEMIEMLETKTNATQQIINEGGRYCMLINPKQGYATALITKYYDELCDALWESVKSILDKLK